jgi:serine/threonine protein kinase
MNSKTPGQFSQDVTRAPLDSNLDKNSTEFNQITQDFHGPVNKPNRIPGLFQETIPGYELMPEIARGGMGIVYAAIDKLFGREVAIKIMKPGMCAGAFRREARIAAKLNHPGIPPVHSMGSLTNGVPFLVMKLIRGETLDRLLGRRSNPDQDLGKNLSVFEQICQAVGYAHAQGIIHRDLKPQNIMVGAYGEVQVMDWGLARDLKLTSQEDDGVVAGNESQAEDSQISVVGQIKGTPAYMAPEQARGEPVDTRADIFALGGILAAILTGKPPFAGNTALDTLAKATKGDLGDMASRLRTSGADMELQSICSKCLAIKAEDRPADSTILAKEVASYRANVEEKLRKAELDRVRHETERKARRVKTWLAATLVAVLLCGMTIAVWQALQISEEKNKFEDQKNQANRLREVADQQRDEADRQRETANQEKNIAKQNEVIATKQAQLALDTFQFVIQDVNGILRGKPGLADTRHSILLAVSKQWDRLDLKLTGGVRGEAITTLMALRHEIALGYEELERYQQADKEFARVYAMSAERIATQGRTPVALENRAKICHAWAMIKNRVETKEDEGMKLFEEAASLTREALANQDTKPSRYRDGLVDMLALILQNIGKLHVDYGRIHAAADNFEKVIELMEGILARIRSAPEYNALDQNLKDMRVIGWEISRDKARLGLAYMYIRMGRTEESLILYEKVIEARRKVHDRRKDLSSLKLELAGHLGNYAQSLVWIGRLDKALQLQLESNDLLELIYNEDKKQASNKRQLSTAFYRSAILMDLLAKTEDYRKFLEKSRILRQELVDGSPDKINKGNLLLVLARQGKVKEVQKILMQKDTPQGANEMDSLTTARAFAQLSRQSNGTARLDDINKGLMALEQALDKGFMDPFRISREPDLIPLRNEKRFQELLLRLEKNANVKLN